MAAGSDGPLPHVGRIKSFNALKGFGFVMSSASPKDIIFGRNNLPEPIRKSDCAGLEVHFDAAIDGKGLRVTRMVVQGDVFKLGQTLPPASGCGRLHGRTNSVFEGNGDDEPGHVGLVKSCNMAKGYGFIVSPEFPVDVMFSTKELPPGVTPEPEMPCTFQSCLTHDGRYKATFVKFQVPGTDWAATAAGMVGMQGVIKNYNGAYGFITAKEIDNVYFKPYDLTNITADQIVTGTPVSFDLIYHKDGKPQARNIGPGALPANYQKRTASEAFGGGDGMKSIFDLGALASKRVALTRPGPEGDVNLISGFISNYRPASSDGTRKGGCGFIKCLDIGDDIWFSQDVLPTQYQHMDAQSMIGTPVQFKLKFAPDGKMSAQYLLL